MAWRAVPSCIITTWCRCHSLRVTACWTQKTRRHYVRGGGDNTELQQPYLIAELYNSAKLTSTGSHTHRTRTSATDTGNVVNTVATERFIFLLLLLCADNNQLCEVSDSPLASGGRSKAAAACRHMEHPLRKVRISHQ